MQLTILHTNDFHGKLTEEKAEFIRRQKEANEPCLYLDSGDCIKAGNLAIPLKPDPAWTLLAKAGCDAGTLGNRETHVLEPAFRAKLAGAQHPLVVANLRCKGGRRDSGTEGQRDEGTEGQGDVGLSDVVPTHRLIDSPAHTLANAPSPHPTISSSHHPLPRALIIEKGGVRVGVIGVMVPMVTARMKTAFASAFLWDPPIPEAAALAVELRPQVDLLIALTHIGYREDVKLAQACPELDLILGGHSHTTLDRPERIGNCWIGQGGSHGRFVGRYVWESGVGIVRQELILLPNGPSSA